MTYFSDFDLPEDLLQSLEKIGFKSPTPVQEASIPLALAGKDILGSAQTGTGKTAAFGIPLLAKLYRGEARSALIVSPTRELATQIMKAMRDMSGNSPKAKTALLIGGEPINKQFHQLKRNPTLFVGTPGRINDHLNRKSLDLSKVDYLVLDETDRMLDMGFSVQINEIQKHMPKEKQTLLFSATLPDDIVRLANSYQNNPERIAIGSVGNPAKNVTQEFAHVQQPEKFQALVKQIDDRTGSIIVFVKTKRGCDRIATSLRKANYRAEAIHGDLNHRKRERAIQSFREQNFRILVATDVAARGLDVPHIEHVVNYDLPQCPEDYIHRIGRTARAGAEGHAISFISNAERHIYAAIQRMLDPNAKPDNDNRRSGGNRGRSSGGRSGGGRDHRGGSRDSSSRGGSSRGGYGASRDGARSGSRSGGDFKRREGGEGRSEGRSERSSESRSNYSRNNESRSNNNRSNNNRSNDNRGGARRDNASQDRNDNRRFDNKPKRSYGSDNRNEGRSEGRSENRSGETRGGRPSYGDRPNRDRNESRGGSRDGGYKKSYGSRGDNRSEGRTERKPYRSDDNNRSDNKKSYGDKPKRSYGSDNRSEGGYKKKSFGSSDNRSRSDRNDRSERSDRPNNRSENSGDALKFKRKPSGEGRSFNRDGDNRSGGKTSRPQNGPKKTFSSTFKKRREQG